VVVVVMLTAEMGVGVAEAGKTNAKEREADAHHQ
jgi:hypothetical protein